MKIDTLQPLLDTMPVYAALGEVDINKEHAFYDIEHRAFLIAKMRRELPSAIRGLKKVLARLDEIDPPKVKVRKPRKEAANAD